MSISPSAKHGEFEELYFFDFIDLFRYFMDDIMSKQPETSPPLLCPCPDGHVIDVNYGQINDTLDRRFGPVYFCVQNRQCGWPTFRSPEPE